MTKEHKTQEQLWAGGIDKVGKIAAEIGERVCPRGFRLLSNFGYDAMQSQDHGHVHIVGGIHLGPYA